MLCDECIAKAKHIASLETALREAIDALDDTTSPYMAGSSLDTQWNKRRDRMVTDGRALLGSKP